MARKCPHGKVGYKSKLDALIALSSVQGKSAAQRYQREDKRSESRAYFHKDCGRWHLTSAPKRGTSQETSAEGLQSETDL